MPSKCTHILKDGEDRMCVRPATPRNRILDH